MEFRKIKQIKQRGSEVRVLFEFDDNISPISDELLLAHKWDLEIGDWEFNRTHWAVKNADLHEVLASIAANTPPSPIDALDKFKTDETLEELIAAIRRDITADKHATSLDRLHTYCMKKFTHLLEKRGIRHCASFFSFFSLPLARSTSFWNIGHGDLSVGRASSTDVLEASARAYLAAVNKILARQPRGRSAVVAGEEEVATAPPGPRDDSVTSSRSLPRAASRGSSQ